MHYRREIDGLRAIAVLPVILFHAGFTAFSGGFAGVDVFFVISGFLITSIILEQRREGRFSLGHFYERRARRILPALFLVMLVCLPAAWFCLLPHQLRYFAQSLVATSTFLSNVFFYLKSNYFNEAADVTPLLHTWSLAVEEQFYLFYPVLLMTLWRVGERRLVAALWVLALSSLLLAQAMLGWDPAAAFFLLPTRGWELLAGALASVHFSRQSPGVLAGLKSRPWVAQGLSLSGLLLIAVSVLIFDQRTPFPGLPALAPTLGAVLVLLFADQRTGVGRLLGSRLLVGVGLISYSAYLWHQPLFAFARALRDDGLSSALAVMLCVLVLPLAAFSWYWVERPLRSGRVPLGPLLAGLGSLMVAFVTLGYFGHKTDGFLSYKIAQVDPAFQRYVIDKRGLINERVARWERELEGSDRPFGIEPGKRRLLILGDSKSEDLYVSMKLNQPLFPQVQLRRAALDDECMGQMTESLATARATLGDRIRGLIASDKNCRASIEHLKASQLLDHADEIVLSTTWQEHTWRDAVRLVVDLARPQRPVTVVSTANFNDVASLSMRVASSHMDTAAASHYFWRNISLEQNRPSDELGRAMSKLAHARYLEKLELFCDLPAQKCPLFGNSADAYVYDGGHVTVPGAEYLGRQIRAVGWFNTGP